jgi:hypothetical protein
MRTQSEGEFKTDAAARIIGHPAIVCEAQNDAARHNLDGRLVCPAEGL